MEELKKTYRRWWEYVTRSQYLINIYNKHKGMDRKQAHKAMLENISTARTDDNKACEARLKEVFEISVHLIYEDFFENGPDEFVKLQIEREKCTSCEGGFGRPEHIKRDMDDSRMVFISTFGREPTLDEFIDFFPVFISSDIFEYKLTIRPYGFTFNQIVAELKDILAPEFTGSKSPQSIHRQYSGPNSVDTEQLQIYLDIYDLFTKENSAEAIISTIYPGTNKETDPDFESKRRTIYRHYEKAKRIIRNGEGGVFPGTYKSPPRDTLWHVFRVS